MRVLRNLSYNARTKKKNKNVARENKSRKQFVVRSNCKRWKINAGRSREKR